MTTAGRPDQLAAESAYLRIEAFGKTHDLRVLSLDAPSAISFSMLAPGRNLMPDGAT